MVRAKFTVTGLDPVNGGITIKMDAVVGGSAENKKFFTYTPSGSITLNTVNTSAAGQFEVGASYYVDFTKAE
jgi:hypothetical protein